MEGCWDIRIPEKEGIGVVRMYISQSKSEWMGVRMNISQSKGEWRGANMYISQSRRE